ncbi:DUF3575 domain-containing protein [Persephonella sp.]
MKKLALIACSAALISTGAVAQPNYNISINPFGLAFGNLNVKAEFYKHENVAPSIEGNYWSFSSGGADYKAYGIGLSARRYTGENFDRWFYQAGIEAGSLEVKVYGSTGTAVYYGFYTLAGYRWAFQNNITVDLGLGIGLYSGEVSINGAKYDEFSGVLPKGVLSIGYNF